MDTQGANQDKRPDDTPPARERGSEPGSGEGAASAWARLQKQERSRANDDGTVDLRPIP